MTTPLPFAKVAGTGNDFILLDRRRRPLRGSPTALARAWCDRKRGVGADGLLLVLPSRKADARMRIFNPDGSEAAMCGNGLRCVAWYLHAKDHGKRELTVETGAGLMRLEITGHEKVRAYLRPPKDLHLGLRLARKGRHYTVHAVNSGVPHAVLLVHHLQSVDLAALGPFIRHHRLFGSAGTNVNLVKILSPHRIAIRTFERGVEAETLACGTGSVASAIIGSSLARLKPPIEVLTAGGERLTVGFHQDRQPWKDLYLEGPAEILFEGGVAP